MGGENYDRGEGIIVSFFFLFVGVPLILLGIVGILAALMAVTVGLP